MDSVVGGFVVTVVGVFVVVCTFVVVVIFVVTGVCVGDVLVVVGALVMDVSHLTFAAQSQYLNCELKSNPLGQVLM